MSKFNNKWMFFAPPDDGGGVDVEEIDADLVPLDGSDDALDDTTETSSATTDNSTTKPAAPPLVDAAALAAQFGQVLSQHLPQQKQEQAPLSPEEAKKLLKVWEPDEKWLTDFDNLESRKAAIAAMRDGVVQQAAVLAQHYVQEMQAQLHPQLQAVQQFQAQQREQRFHSAHPALAKPEFTPIVQAVAQNLVQKGQRFNDEKSLFDAIANGVESVFKAHNPEFKLTGQKPAAGGIPVTTPGSGSAAGGGTGGGGAKVPKAVSFMPKIR